MIPSVLYIELYNMTVSEQPNILHSRNNVHQHVCQLITSLLQLIVERGRGGRGGRTDVRLGCVHLSEAFSCPAMTVSSHDHGCVQLRCLNITHCRYGSRQQNTFLLRSVSLCPVLHPQQSTR